MRKSEGQRIPEKEIANFQFVDLKQNPVPYIAVMCFGACVDSYGNVIDQNKDQCNALLGALVHYAGIQKTRTGVLSFLK